MRFEDLQAAMAELGLAQEMTARDVKERYRLLVKTYHPDRNATPDNDKIRRINAAYGLVNTYLQEYRYAFSKEQFFQQYPEERLREQFYGTDSWGGKG